jgi:competence protein ComEC
VKECYSGPASFRLDNALIEVVYPHKDIQESIYDNVNNSSLVTKITLEDTTVLFPGDIEFEAEGEVLQGADLDADIVLVPHHGSSTSSSMRFISEVSPKVCIISNGMDNSYGHPHKSTLRSYENFGLRCLRTDQEGEIGFRMAPEGLNRIGL